METKEYLIKVLDKLKETWPLAKWLKKVIINWWLDNENLMNLLIDALWVSIHNVKGDVDKEKLKKSLTVLQKMKNLEEEERARDVEELDKLIEQI